MVIALNENEIDPIADGLDAMLTEEEEREVKEPRVKVRPGRDKTITKGRANVRMAWMWDGTETSLPLAWNPEGTRHDGARHYLLKRFCLCCHTGGFFGKSCPNCVKRACTNCGASTDKTKVIPNFYLHKEDVPFPAKFYGPIPCFLAFCTRRDSRGFLTEQDMRMHARSRHRLEYQSHMESLAEAKTDELESLRRRLDALTTPPTPVQPPIHRESPTSPQPLTQEERDRIYQEVSRERMAKARAGRKK